MTTTQGLVHISTAYCNTDKYHISEEIQEQPMDPGALLDLCSVIENQNALMTLSYITENGARKTQ